MSYIRFLDLIITDDIPDSCTVWLFREQLTDLRLLKKIFNVFLKELEKLNLIVNEGKIIDASFVEVPKQLNNRDENQVVKDGMVPVSFTDNPHREAQKDTCARWTQKNKVNYFWGKSYVKSSAKSKLINKYMVTDALIHNL